MHFLNKFSVKIKIIFSETNAQDQDKSKYKYPYVQDKSKPIKKTKKQAKLVKHLQEVLVTSYKFHSF